MSNNNLLTENMVNSVKHLVQQSVYRNPGANDKDIKNSFEKKLKGALVGKILESPKYILKVFSVDVRRIKKNLRFTITTRPTWKLQDEGQQL